MSYIGKVELKASDIRTSGVITISGGATNTVALGGTAPSVQTVVLTVNGVTQATNTYTISGSTLTLASGNFADGDTVEAITINDIGTTIVPADGTVTSDKLDSAINTTIDANTAKVTNATHTGDVTGATALTIADNAVTLAKMAGLARGKIIVGDSSGDPSALTLGATNKVLKSDGSDAVWGDDAGGGMVLVDSGELTSDVTEWQSLNTMSSTYRNYLLVYNSIAPDSSSGAGNHIYIRFGDATISTNNNHQWVLTYILSDSNGGGQQSTGDTNGMKLGEHVQSEPDANIGSNGISGQIWINNPASASYNTTFTHMSQWLGMDEDFGTDYSTFGRGGGQVSSKSADVSFEFHCHTGGLEGTSITSYYRLYGLKDS